MPTLDCCPACNASLIEHSSERDDEFEWWRFGCSAEVVNQNGTLIENNPCREALPLALKRLNEQLTKA